MMSRLRIAWLALAVAAVAAALPARAQTDLPTDKGLPLVVTVGVAFVELPALNENNGTYKATIDLRLRWTDLRLRQPGATASDPPRVYRGPEAQTEIAKIWTPAAEVTNLRGTPSYAVAGLRISPDGQVELIRRITGEFSLTLNVERFPFDRQKLPVEVAVRDRTTSAVTLEFRQDDLDFSRASAGVALDGWEIGLVTLRSDPLPGWYGASHARVMASLEIIRLPAGIIAVIFIPLFASLLIPLLGVWLNRVEDGVFQIETFEFVNLIVGGLFAVIALNFTVNSVFQVLGSGDNPVARLFALNYVALGFSLLVNILIFRFGLVARLCGRYVQEQLYLVLIWAAPVLMVTTAATVLLIAFA